MSVYIKGMKMPTSCAFCRFCEGLADTLRGTCAFCIVDGKHRDAQTNDGCPLVPVPEHGDLIDRDATIEKIRHLSDEIDKKLGYEKSAPYITMALYMSNADDFPTIIPAEEGDNG